MSLKAICQRCGAEEFEWSILRADINIGRLKHWKVALCVDCLKRVECAVIDAMGFQP